MGGFFGSIGRGGPAANGVRASSQEAGGGVVFDPSNPEHADYLRSGGMTASGAVVSEQGALRIAAAWRCVHIIAGAVANMPLDLMERSAEDVRRPAVGHAVRDLISVRPNGWQTPQDFKRMLTAHVALRGNGYGIKITSMGRVIEVWPVHPSRMEPVQDPATMTLAYDYTRANGSKIRLAASDVLHLRGLTLDGVKGLGVLAHARETLGLALQSQVTAARLFKQGVVAGGALKTPNQLSQEAFDRLKADLEKKNAGAENAHKWLILEEGLEVAQVAMTAEDMQFLEERKFERSDIAMFFGVPPHMIGDTDKSTSWGTGIEAQTTGFVTFTLEDYLTQWEEALRRDLLTPAEAVRYYARFNRSALIRGDIKTRWQAHVAALQWGVRSPNDVRALEDENPREGGDIYYPPPNTAGKSALSDKEEKEREDA